MNRIAGTESTKNVPALSKNPHISFFHEVSGTVVGMNEKIKP